MWKDLPGYVGTYQVSDDGRVRSLDRVVVGRWGPTILKGRNLRLQPGRRGVLRVRLSVCGRAASHLVHRLVLSAFVGPCPAGYEVCHADGNPANNQLTNLRYGTQAENMQDRVKHGTSNRGERCGNTKLTEADVLEIRELYGTGRFTQAHLARAFGVTRENVGAIVRRCSWAWLA